MPINIYGFTLLRNGIKYDYPFRECLNALTQMCKHSVIALGDSEDGTELEVAKYDKLASIPTTWDMYLMGDGGKILSQQTNIALKHLEELKIEEKNAWGFYLQTDELIHENDFEKIRVDIQKAQDQGCDAIRFRYYHFWLSHNEVAISKRWYPQEIRAIKLNAGIESYGDAQGFKGYQKVFESDVHIYHYGHVRDKDKREAKQELLIKMIRPREKYKKYKAREERDFNKTETLSYLGPHPKWMKERIERFKDTFQAPSSQTVSIHDPHNRINEDFKAKVLAKEVFIVSEKKPSSLSLEPSFFKKIGLSKNIPRGMKNSSARPWSTEKRMEFLLWANGISTL